MSDLLLLEHLLYVNDLEAQGHSSIVKYWLAPKAHHVSVNQTRIRCMHGV